MNVTTLLAFSAGMLFMGLLLTIGCVMAFRGDDGPLLAAAMFIFRTILALAGGAFAGILTGFLEIRGHAPGFTIRTGGGLAVFVALYLWNPPDHIKRSITGISRWRGAPWMLIASRGEWRN